MIPLIFFGLAIAAGSLYISKNYHSENTQVPTISVATSLPTTQPTAVAKETPSPVPVQTPKETHSPSPTPKPTIAPTPVPASGPPSSGHSRYTATTEVGNFLIDVVSLPIGAEMVTDTASDSECGDNCPTIPLSDYVSRNGAYAGINGTYFCPSDYESCAGKVNSFDFPVYNTRLGKWINATNLHWNGRSMILKSGGLQFLRNSNSYGGGGSAGIVNHPGVLENGTVIANQMGANSSQMTKGTRGGIGFSESNIFLVIARGASVEDLGYVFKSLGAKNAMNLDGGGSAALWYGGYKVGPGRALPNAIVFK